MNIVDIVQNIVTVASSLASLGVVTLLLIMLATHGVRQTIATVRHLIDVAIGRKTAESTLSYVETSDKLIEQVRSLSKRYVELQAQTVSLTEERNECQRIVTLLQRRIDGLHSRIDQQERRYRHLAVAVDTIKLHADDIECVAKELQRVIECVICKGERCDHRSNPSDAEC